MKNIFDKGLLQLCGTTKVQRKHCILLISKHQLYHSGVHSIIQAYWEIVQIGQLSTAKMTSVHCHPMCRNYDAFRRKKTEGMSGLTDS